MNGTVIEIKAYAVFVYSASSGYSESLHQMVRENMPEYRPVVIGRIAGDDQNGYWAGYQIADQSKNRWLFLMNMEIL